MSETNERDTIPDDGNEFLTDQEVEYLLDALTHGLEEFVEEARSLDMTKTAMLEFLSNRIDEIVAE